MVAVGASNVGIGSVWSEVVVVGEGVLVDWPAVVVSFGTLVDASVALGLAMSLVVLVDIPVSLVDGVLLVIEAATLVLAVELLTIAVESLLTVEPLRVSVNSLVEELLKDQPSYTQICDSR
jgi:hypothetical protein